MSAKRLVIAAALSGFATVASAKTCEELAAACTKQAGQAACFDQNRIKICKSTGIYTSPDGKAEKADKK